MLVIFENRLRPRRRKRARRRSLLREPRVGARHRHLVRGGDRQLVSDAQVIHAGGERLPERQCQPVARGVRQACPPACNVGRGALELRKCPLAEYVARRSEPVALRASTPRIKEPAMAIDAPRATLGLAFVERQANIWKRHWAWEAVWLIYGVVNTLAITFIAKEAARP